MRYYKLIKNNNIIGVITSNDFIVYSPITDCYLSATDLTGEYAVYKNKLYRSSWMQPIKQESQYEEVLIITITEEEYNSFIEALKVQDEIDNINTQEEEEEKAIEAVIAQMQIDPIDQLSIDFIRSSKLLQMSQACHHTIEEGFDLEIRGENHHFSLTIQDQLNLMSLNSITKINSLIPYHADGEETTFYTAEEINQIITAAADYKNYQTAYYNSLKTYINTLDTIEAIAAITYGTPIPDEYKSEVLKALE